MNLCVKLKLAGLLVFVIGTLLYIHLHVLLLNKKKEKKKKNAIAYTPEWNKIVWLTLGYNHVFLNGKMDGLRVNIATCSLYNLRISDYSLLIVHLQ